MCPSREGTYNNRYACWRWRKRSRWHILCWSSVVLYVWGLWYGRMNLRTTFLTWGPSSRWSSETPSNLTCPLRKIFIFLIENLKEIVPKLRSQWGLGQEPHWESRTSSRTSLRIKNLIKNLIKNQDLGQDLIEILIEIRNEDFFSYWESQWESQCGLAQDLDFWWGSWWGSWFLMRFLPKTSLRS